MKHNNTVFLIISALVLTTTSCTRIADPDSGIRADYLVFGRFAGLCLGEQCVEIFKIEKTALFEDTLDQHPANLYNGSYVRLSDEQYNEVSHLTAIVPYDVFSLQDGVIGQPDAHDQGGIYLELVKDGVRRSWRIDTVKERIPEFLHAFLDSAQAAVNKLQ
ncbi:MAG: hypothetical protein L0Y80_11695 [Ignavibacteriae bacterium]|nr:hypothetical protein [Ignavibacteriota bacterium]